MKTQDKLTTLKDYLNLNYPITFYPENEGRYTVIIQDLAFLRREAPRRKHQRK